ncbi:hypothetical protein G9464_02630 [Halostella sp. JP-L12]|uniref:hypothetical protein n=1 Tax=Halostella TaxID=1843185 RepID=UPI0013CE4E3A|nr:MULTISPECIES: hypothetical protein [Halostella]NHN46495.1 hypothetical protein [Halostella sp. JP-L12]
MSDEKPNWIATLKTKLGDDLRVAVEYDETGYVSRYVRDDLDEEYSSDDLNEIRQEMIVLMLGKDRIEEFLTAGEFRALTYWLDDAIIYHFPETEAFYGRVVSVEPEGESMRAAIFDACSTKA